MADNNSYYALLQDAHVQHPNVRVDLFERLLCDRLNWSKTDYILNANKDVLNAHRQQFLEDVNRLANDEPLQYIVGCEWFYGRCFTVNANVLIPRPETELLVETVLNMMTNDDKLFKIIDIGTGSGAIGVTLALEKTNVDVTISDISKEALAIAKQNANDLGAIVKSVVSDVFNEVTETFDIIVSNPPYISELEKSLMDSSVLAYEPHLALFAKDNGLAIYTKLLEQAVTHLNPDGIVALEIGFSQAESVVNLAKHYFPHKTVHVIKDFAKLDRIVVIQ